MLIKYNSIFQELTQTSKFLRLFLLFGRLWFQLDPGSIGEVLQGFFEIPTLALHQVRKNITAFTASEAVPGSSFLGNTEKAGVRVLS